MKNNILKYTSIAAIAALVSCNKIETATPAEPVSAGMPETITAMVDDADVKASVSLSDGKVYWQENDLIKVNGVTYTCYEVKTDRGLFKKTGSETPSGDNLACYPASLYTVNGYALPSHTHIGSTNVVGSYFPMMAKFDPASSVLAFKNICSILKFDITNGDSEARYIDEVAVSTHVPVSGAFTCQFGADGNPQITLSDNMCLATDIHFDNLQTLAAGGKLTAYIAIPAGTYQGVNLKVTGYSENKRDDYTKFLSCNKTKSGSQTYTRSTIHDFAVSASGFARNVQGDGTMESPFRIYDAQDITYINNMMADGRVVSSAAKDFFSKSCIRLYNDVTIASSSWTHPLGNSTESSAFSFKGVFDGNGKTISFTSDEDNPVKFPLFFDLESGAVIKDLVVKGYFQHTRSGIAQDTENFSPFFYSAIGAKMVSVIFRGKVEKADRKGYYDTTTSNPTIFGAMDYNCSVYGCYADYVINDHGFFRSVNLVGNQTCISDIKNVVGDYLSSDNPQEFRTAKTYKCDGSKDKVQITDASFNKVASLNDAVTLWNATKADARSKANYKFSGYPNSITLTKIQ